MEELQSQIFKAHQQIKSEIEILKRRLTQAPAENLIIHLNNNSVQYYTEKNSQRTYLSKQTAQHQIKLLLQKKYDLKCLKIASQRQRAITAFLKRDSTITYNEILEAFPLECRNLIQPISMTKAQKLQLWKNKSFRQKEIRGDITCFKTINGDLVRSKSEKIIADLLYRYSVPYRYEMALSLNGFGTIYPDFTIYDVHNNKLIFLEHFGMIDDPSYSMKMITRYNAYLKSNLADQLIISMESSTRPLDIKALTILIKPYSCV